MRFGVNHLAEENGVVARFNDGRKPALEVCDAASKQWRAIGFGKPVDALKAAFGLAGKGHRQIALRFTEDVDCKVRARPEVHEEIAGVIDADQDEGWLNRNRGK